MEPWAWLTPSELIMSHSEELVQLCAGREMDVGTGPGMTTIGEILDCSRRRSTFALP